MLRLLSMKRAASVLAGMAIAAAGGLAVAAAVVGAPADKAAALARLASVATTDSNTEQAAPPEWARRPIPARMLSPGVPVPISPSVLQVRNGWLVSDGRTLVAANFDVGASWLPPSRDKWWSSWRYSR